MLGAVTCQNSAMHISNSQIADAAAIVGTYARQHSSEVITSKFQFLFELQLGRQGKKLRSLQRQLQLGQLPELVLQRSRRRWRAHVGSCWLVLWTTFSFPAKFDNETLVWLACYGNATSMLFLHYQSEMGIRRMERFWHLATYDASIFFLSR